MKHFSLSSFPLYRWRYAITYTLIALGTAALLLIATLFSPGATSPAEINQAVTASNLRLENISLSPIVDGPYHALQKAIFMLLGVSFFTIKLPSLFFGALTAIACIVLLHRWFRPNVASLTAILIVTTGPFLLIAQSGTPRILYLLWPTLLLLFATLIMQRAKYSALWYILLAVTAAFSLYSPLSIYVLIALTITAIAHPKLRLALRSFSPQLFALPLLLLAVLLIPLIMQIVKDPSIALTLLGLSQELPVAIDNVRLLAMQYLNVFQPVNGTLMTPALGLGSLALIVLGGYRIIREHHTVRSHAIITWLILLIPAIILNPEYAPITFIPFLLIMATGIDTLIRNWYMLFPKNPYARFAGLIPLVFLIITMTGTGIERTVYGYHYDPKISQDFTRDIRLLDDAVASSTGSTTIVVSNDELPFYSTYATYAKVDAPLKITTQKPSTSTSTLYTRAAQKEQSPSGTPDTIIISSQAQDADRFYLYKSADQ